MRPATFLLLVSMIWAGSAIAETGGTLGLYVDTEGIECNIPDVVPGLLTINLIHKTDGAAASQFSLPIPACFTAVFLSGGDPWGFCPNPIAGCAIGYGQCLSGAIYVIPINFFGYGTTPPCCKYTVMPDPDAPSGEIEVVDCEYNIIYGLGEVAVINGDGSCPCGYTVPAEETTWGQVKALFVE
ncbi:MAG: hypothetical protein JSW58_09435 [Candidatus Latescibacterota bacterium]|nr:MAG: hypothetical protein JSW58_09435 [Candidatus Latescibacterota bacterium]